MLVINRTKCKDVDKLKQLFNVFFSINVFNLFVNIIYFTFHVSYHYFIQDYRTLFKFFFPASLLDRCGFSLQLGVFGPWLDFNIKIRRFKQMLKYKVFSGVQIHFGDSFNKMNRSLCFSNQMELPLVLLETTSEGNRKQFYY